MPRQRQLSVHRLAILSALLFAGGSYGGQLSIAPVRVYLDESTASGAIELSNPSGSPVTVQVNGVEWRQTSTGEDEYEPTSDLIAFPPMFTIPPGGLQLVRVGISGERSRQRERAFRLYFTELPPAHGQDLKATLRMRLRIGIPVFAAPSEPPRADLAMVRSEFDGQQFYLTLRNSGNQHIRLTDLYADELQSAERTASARYLLPGAGFRFPVDLPAGEASPVIVKAVTDQLGVSEYQIDWSAVDRSPGEGALARR